MPSFDEGESSVMMETTISDRIPPVSRHHTVLLPICQKEPYTPTSIPSTPLCDLRGGQIALEGTFTKGGGWENEIG
jgi:hypothetical protein